MAMQRLFFAIDLPDTLKEALEPGAESLRDLGRHVRPVRRGGYHITMLFLGEQPDSNIPYLGKLARQAVEGARPCKLEISGIGFFPRVSFLTLSGEIETLTIIASILADSCVDFLEKPETRRFKAHVTLARHKKKVTPSEKDRIRDAFAEFKGQSWIADELVLFSSELTPQGAIYTPVENFRFGGVD
jgi:2'-5' RNA ligase